MTQFPIGTVTFLFSDVVGSSRLWDLHHDDMRQAMVLHDEFALKTIESHSGVVVKHTGDGLFAVFASAFDAVNAGLAMHAGLSSRGSGSVSLEVRIGLHTGEAEHRDNDYFGPSVSRAARVMSTADAARVHLSTATQEVVRDRLPEGWQISAGSEITLRGFERPERVFRLVRAGEDLTAPTVHDESPQRRASWIAVLPFDNLGKDSEQEYFADGITEELIMRLGGFRSLRVIARTSSFTYRGSDRPLPTIAHELGVKFVLTGSVRRSRSRTRVSVELIEAATRQQIWSRTYELEIEDVFDAQDQITDAITSAIDPAIRASATEGRIHRRPGSLDAWDHVQRGWAAYYKIKKVDNDRARQHFAAAIDIDAMYAQAHVGMSSVNFWDAWLLWVDDPAASIILSLESAKRALDVDAHDADAHAALAGANFGLGRLDATTRAAEQAIALNPSLPLAHIWAGAAAVHGDDPEGGIEMITRGIRLNPQDPIANFYFGVRSIGHFLLHDNDAAIADARSAVAIRYGYLIGRIVLVTALADADRIAEAHAELDTLLGIHPDFRPSTLDQYVFNDDDRARLIQRLHDAGLPT